MVHVQTGGRSQTLGAIFDLDGVLLDSTELHRRAWYRLAEEVGARMSDAFFQETFGLPNSQILPRLLERQPAAEELQALSERKEELFRQEARGNIQLFPGAVELLEALHRNGFRLAVGSSTPSSNLRFLASELALDRSLEALVGADDVARGKPEPDVFLCAAERIAVAPRRCVVLEDAFAGFQAAAAAGMRCVGVATTHSRATLERRPEVHLVVDSLAELRPAELKALLAY